MSGVIFIPCFYCAEVTESMRNFCWCEMILLHQSGIRVESTYNNSYIRQENYGIEVLAIGELLLSELRHVGHHFRYNFSLQDMSFIAILTLEYSDFTVSASYYNHDYYILSAYLGKV